MTVQLATSTRNAMLDAIETDAGTSAILKIRTGAQPANCAAADSGSVLATVNLPSDWMAAASGGIGGDSRCDAGDARQCDAAGGGRP